MNFLTHTDKIAAQASGSSSFDASNATDIGIASSSYRHQQKDSSASFALGQRNVESMPYFPNFTWGHIFDGQYFEETGEIINIDMGIDIGDDNTNSHFFYMDTFEDNTTKKDSGNDAMSAHITIEKGDSYSGASETAVSTFSKRVKGDIEEKQDCINNKERKGLLACHYCKRILSSKHSLKRHIVSKHETEKRYHCIYCKKKSSSMDSLKAHIATQHGINKIYKCIYCDHIFDEIKARSAHCDIQHNNKMLKLKLPCPECGQKFANKSNFTRHINEVHKEKKDHRCSMCDKRFSRNYHLELHVIENHCEKEKEKRTDCDKS